MVEQKSHREQALAALEEARPNNSRDPGLVLAQIAQAHATLAVLDALADVTFQLQRLADS